MCFHLSSTLEIKFNDNNINNLNNILLNLINQLIFICFCKLIMSILNTAEIEK